MLKRIGREGVSIHEQALSLIWMNVTSDSNIRFGHLNSIPVDPAVLTRGAVASHEAPDVGLPELPADGPAVIASGAVVVVLEEEPAVTVLENWSAVQPPVSLSELSLEIRILFCCSVEKSDFQRATQGRHGSSCNLQGRVRAPFINRRTVGSELPIVQWRFFAW